jgi:hypothetical protein
MARATPDPHNIDPSAVLGLTGLKRFAGRVYEEFLPELQGARGRKVIKEMTTQDPIIGAIRKTFEMLLRQVSWDVQPFSVATEDQVAADFLKDCMDDMSRPWIEVIVEALTMLDYGWEYSEIVYKLRKGDSKNPTQRSKFTDGKFGWRKIDTRSQDTLWKWDFDDEGGVQGFWQMAAPHYRLVFIPIEKALLFRTTSRKGNPEGESMYRNAYRPWFFKKHIENLEGVGIERDLAGLPVLYVPADLLDPGASADKKSALQSWQTLITAIKRDEQEGVILPGMYDDAGHREYELTLLTSGGTRQYDTNAIVTRKNQEMAMSCLADLILLGHENVGSFALADSKKDVLSTAMGSYLDAIAVVFNTHAIPRLWKLNGMPTDRLPVLVHGDIGGVDLAEVAAYITALAGAGAPLFPNEDLLRHLMELAGLPTPQEGADAAAGKAPRVWPALPGDLDPDHKETGGDDEDVTEADQPTDPSGDGLRRSYTDVQSSGDDMLRRSYTDKAEVDVAKDNPTGINQYSGAGGARALTSHLQYTHGQNGLRQSRGGSDGPAGKGLTDLHNQLHSDYDYAHAGGNAGHVHAAESKSELHFHLHEGSPLPPPPAVIPDYGPALLELAKATQANPMAERFERLLVKMSLRKEQPVQVDVHVPPAQIAVQNAGDVHVAPATVNVAAPIVNVPTPPAPVLVNMPSPPTTTEIEYETGPDGKSRPKAIHRKGA